VGYEAVKASIHGCGWEQSRRQFAFRWLREKEIEAERRADQIREDTHRMRQDTRRMMWLAIAAIVIAIVSLIIAFLK